MLTPGERHALGAHYTPRAYVERLVLPTVIEPLRDEWRNVQAAALLLANEGRLDAARAEVDAFHHRLCQIRALDPACGSANFLYVTLEHMKRLEGEVLDQMHVFGAGQQRLEAEGLTVDPYQFLGLELNPRAAAIAELVLWIGYLQWHFRTHGSGLQPQLILKDFRNIECRDAVLAAYGWDELAPPLADFTDPARQSAARESLLLRLVALNAERAAEEAKGHVRWLRPDYQQPGTPQQTSIAIATLADAAERGGATTAAPPAQRLVWPSALPEQVAAVARVLAESPVPLAATELAARFTGKGAWKKRLPQIIDTLEALGRVRRDAAGDLVA